MSENLKIWESVCRPPASALKQIKGGRLSGMTDINPQWRMKAMTEQFGPAGLGWSYSVERLWTEPGTEGQVFAFAQVSLLVNGHVMPVPGIGGSMLISKDKNGLYHNDEAYKMAITDALSVAMKALGVAADIYQGLWDGSKYVSPEGSQSEKKGHSPSDGAFAALTSEEQEKAKEIAATIVDLWGAGKETGAYEQFYCANLSNEMKLGIWELLRPNSKVRNGIKAINEANNVKANNVKPQMKEAA